MTTSIFYLLRTCLLLDIIKAQNLCGDHLLPSIPDDHITASSSLVPAGGKASTSPERARLNTQQTSLKNGTVLMGAWAPASDNKGQYIQATFDGLTYVESIITQGQNPSGGFVKLYKLEYTEDGKTWKSVDLDSTPGVAELFKGNSDADTPVESELDCPLFAKGIRIIPLEWDSHMALRFDVKGCYLDNTPVVITTPILTTPTTPVTTPTTPTTSSTSSTSKTTLTTTPLTTIPPFLPGIPTPFGLSSTTTVTTLKQTTTVTTTRPQTTINMLTLIQWFLTELSNTSHTTVPVTTPLTTLPSTRITTTRLPTTTTPLTTTQRTTTTIPPFLPGILNPFGTTKRP